MNQKELKELIEFLIEKDIAEFELERGDVKVKIKRAGEQCRPASAPDSRYFAVHAAPRSGPAKSGTVRGAATARRPRPLQSPCCGRELHMVKSPIVGTFYEVAFARLSAVCEAGRHGRSGTGACIVEAMKLMNEIESDAAGEIVKKLATNGQPIEYGQELFVMRPKSEDKALWNVVHSALVRLRSSGAICLESAG